MIYGREALRQYREQEQQQPARQPDLLSQIPDDAPMDDATITVWNGERWVTWARWRATAPVVLEDAPPKHAPLKESKAADTVPLHPRGSNKQKVLWQE
jgi:hypothetical protein